MYYNATLRCVLCNYCCSGKARSITKSEGLFVARMQSACTIVSSVVCPAVRCFPNYLINGTICGKNVIEHNVC